MRQMGLMIIWVRLIWSIRLIWVEVVGSYGSSFCALGQSIQFSVALVKLGFKAAGQELRSFLIIKYKESHIHFPSHFNYNTRKLILS